MYNIYSVAGLLVDDKQELDWKRPMVSPVAVQRNQSVSHKL